MDFSSEDFFFQSRASSPPNLTSKKIALTAPRSGENANFITILSLIAGFDLKSIEIDRNAALPARDDDAVRERYTAYPLGAGLTCNVFQLPAEDRGQISLPDGSVVAMKAYALDQTPGSGSDTRRYNRVYDMIRRELNVFCHPFLRTHENVCRLRYIAWEEADEFPILALELAAFGTLQDVMQSSTSRLSGRQILNLSVDLSDGLASLHACNIVHGDIKPTNIIVQRHEQRQMVAKLTDFSGAAFLAIDSEQEGPRMSTPMWSAPEVALRSRDEALDWKAADVYSYGLVLATLWAKKPPVGQSSCFLEELLPSTIGLSREAALAQQYQNLLRWKTAPAEEANSVLQLALKVIPNKSLTILVNMKELQELLSMCLVPSASSREPSSHISNHMLSLADTVGRSRLNLYDFDSRTSEEVTSKIHIANDPLHMVSNTSSDNLSTWSHLDPFASHFPGRTGYVLKRLSLQVEHFEQTLPNGPPNFPTDVDDEIQPGTLVSVLSSKIQEMARMVSHVQTAELVMNSRSALVISQSYWLGIGCRPNQSVAFDWLQKAARIGSSSALEVLGLVLPSEDPTLSSGIPIRLLLVLGALSASRECQILLSLKFPRLFKVVCLAAQELQNSHLDQSVVDGPFYTNMISRAIEHLALDNNKLDLSGLTLNQSQPDYLFGQRIRVPAFESMSVQAGINLLLSAVRSGNTSGSLQYMSGAIGDILWKSDEGRTLLHLLADIDDNIAAFLAPHLVYHGADLGVACENIRAAHQRPQLVDDQTEGMEWLAIDLAVESNHPNTYAQLLRLHIENKEPILHLRGMVHRLAFSGQTKMLQMLVDASAESPLPYKPGGITLQLNANHYTACLDDMTEKSNPETAIMRRRWLHGPRFVETKSEIVKLLLHCGADPLRNEKGDTVLSKCVSSGDAITLQAIVDLFWKNDGCLLLPYLSDWKNFDGHTALQRSILSSSRKCFDILLEHFPDLIEAQNKDGRRALHAAANARDAEVTRVLLDKGADFMAESHGRSTPLFLALVFGAWEIGDLIYQRCSKAQRDHLFGIDPGSETTLSGALVAAWLGTSTVTIQAFRWLFNHGGAAFFSDQRGECPIWNQILMRPPRPHIRDSTMDLQLLDFLFDWFPDMLNFLDGQSGRSPLHLACWNVNIGAVRLLLAREVQINLDTTSPAEWPESETNPVLGWTALDYCLRRQKVGNVPLTVKKGGDRVVRRWKQDLLQIMKLLIDAGADTGRRNSAFAHIEVATLRSPELASMIRAIDWNDLNVDPFEDSPAWPEPIPIDPEEPSISEQIRQSARAQMLFDTMVFPG